MRIVFCGTPDECVPFLQVCTEVGQVVAALSAPDRPRGRGRQVTPTPVSQWLAAYGAPCLQPDSCADPGLIEALRNLRPDVLVVVAYGRLLPPEMVAVPRLAVNVHLSALPQLRGAAPVVRALQWGLRTTGVVVQLLSPRLDAGAILARRIVPIRACDDAATLSDRLVQAGCVLLREVLEGFKAGLLPAARAQTEAAVTWAPKVSPADALLLPTVPATLTAQRLRAMSPRGGAYCLLEGKRLRILKAVGLWRVTEGGSGGVVVGSTSAGPVVAWGGQVLLARRVQREGGRALEGGALLGGRTLVPGQRVEEPPA